LLQLACFACGTATPSYKADWIDLHQQSNGAALGSGFRIENVSRAERHLLALEAGGILVEQISQGLWPDYAWSIW
jgi:hypothetical protein